MTLVAPEAWRQSSISRFDACAYSLLLEMQAPRGDSGPPANRGTLAHRTIARMENEMRVTGERSYPVELGLVVLNEEVAQVGVPPEDYVHLQARDIEWLRIIITRWCENVSLDASRIIAVEERMFGAVTVNLPEGSYERRFSGQADIMLADPPSGLVFIDYKSGFAPPARKREPQDGVHKDDRLSDHGYPQQVMYGLLALQNYPLVERVTLREYYIMFGEYREASVHRGQLERLQDIVAGVIVQMDLAVADGPESPRWVPTAGTHCGFCPAPRQCPIRDWAGIPTTEEEAKLVAREWIVAGLVRQERAKMAKAWVDAHGPIEIENAKGRREVGWVPYSNGEGRRFTLYEPTDAPESPFDERLGGVEPPRTEPPEPGWLDDNPPF